jgi:hypothetical protein
MYTYPLPRVCNYTAVANKALLNRFDSQVENYSIKDY